MEPTVGDLDIMVPRASLDAVEAALLQTGWEHVKDAEGYDDSYYRRWMHELPPLIHRTRDRMIDVHHTILPLTARPRPNAEAMIAASVQLDNGLRILSPADIIVHAAAHLFADGDLAGGLRNLWDIDRLERGAKVGEGVYHRHPSPPTATQRRQHGERARFGLCFRSHGRAATLRPATRPKARHSAMLPPPEG